MDIKYLSHQHTHIIVDDIDNASEFYRDVMGMFEMQSHNNMTNKGLAAYYGIEDYENFIVSLRFMVIPGVITVKLLQIENKNGYGSREYNKYNKYGKDSSRYDSNSLYAQGIGPVSLNVEDLDAAYKHFLDYSRGYSNKFKVKLLSPPVFLSPLLPHEIGATKHSLLANQKEILDELFTVFPLRAKFQLIDPFNVRWEFNNNII